MSHGIDTNFAGLSVQRDGTDGLLRGEAVVGEQFEKTGRVATIRLGKEGDTGVGKICLKEFSESASNGVLHK